jgi:hypothetical protein
MEMGCNFSRRFGLQHHHPAVGTSRRKWFVPAHLVRPPRTKATPETGHPLVDDFVGNAVMMVIFFIAVVYLAFRFHRFRQTQKAQVIPAEDENL